MNATPEEQLDVVLKALFRICDEVTGYDGKPKDASLVEIESIHREVHHALMAIGLAMVATNAK